MAPAFLVPPTRRTRCACRLLALALLPLAATACSDSGTTTLAPEPAATTPTETTSSVAPSTEAPTTTTLAPTTTTTTTLPPTTTTEAPTAADDLAPFFAAAEELDAQIAAAADEFNAGFDPDAGTIDPAAVDAIAELSTERIGGLIPAGMDLDLETALLVVYTDLQSRISALQGGAERVYVSPDGTVDVEDSLFCLGLGSESKARFDGDLVAARTLADRSSPQAAVAPDSLEAGALALRLQVIGLFNYGCDSCGGAVLEEAIPVDWEAQTVAGAGFEAEFDGTEWQITINAC